MNSYLKIIPYIYLAAALFFIYSGIVRYGEGEEGFWLWFVIAALCVFMFFFRMRFARRFNGRKDEN
ncbi:hypothetical protein [Flavobacterium selenitireducens]|uniref:hypothetical protein n=1 Tax=Flavobacterium selenitireducens TaxID=2722704 RepID=UPI00168C0773|nr:hypothetical protein [Flavobacterium selenitireducens]MBD3583131.1 hypothetical protein [Flavobacterium selenitireducens]